MPSSQPLGSNKSSNESTEELLKALRQDYHKLASNLIDWKEANHEEKKGIYQRLATLEEKALYIPNAEESELIKEAAAFYKTKREFRERLYTTLLEKGLTGLMVFVAASVFFYLKHLLMDIT